MNSIFLLSKNDFFLASNDHDPSGLTTSPDMHGPVAHLSPRHHAMLPSCAALARGAPTSMASI
jgi:hypothetical protein